MVLLIDNYDSFSYNLYQYIGEIDPDIKVIRNAEQMIPLCAAGSPAAFVLLPATAKAIIPIEKRLRFDSESFFVLL